MMKKRVKNFYTYFKNKNNHKSTSKLTIEGIFRILQQKVPQKVMLIKDNYVPYVSMNTRKATYPYGTVYFQDTYYNVDPQKAYDKAKSLGASLCFLTGKIKDNKIDKIPFIVADKPHEYFVEICDYLNKNNKIPTICVTGSVGKTTAKQFLYEVLASKYKTAQNVGNSNLRVHAGEMVQEIKPDSEYYVQEVGGCIPYMVENCAQILRPDCFIITNIGQSHLEAYGSVENIAKDKLSLDKYLKPNGVAILNYDDDILKSVKLNHRVISFGIKNKDVDYYAENIKQNKSLLEMDVVSPAGREHVAVNVFGEHNAYNVLSSFAAGHFAGMTNEEIKRGLSNYRSKGIRQNLVTLSERLLFLDCFNAAYDSVKNALNIANDFPIDNDNKKIVVLGDILELGELSKDIHEQIGQLANDHNFDIVVTIGDASKHIINNISNGNTITYHADSVEELSQYLAENVNRGDFVMFKASHGINLHLAVDKTFGTTYYAAEKKYLGLYKKINAGDFRYNLIAGELELVKATNINGEFSIPEMYKDYKIVALNKCFSNSNVEEVYFNASMRTIGLGSFTECKSLRKVNVKNTKYIASKAFQNCPNLKEVVIENSECHVEKDAFIGCDNVELILPKDSLVIEVAESNKWKYRII